MASLGAVKLPQLAEGGSLDAFLERMQLFFELNKVTSPQDVQVLLMGLSATHYEVLRDLAAPKKPSECTLVEITTALKGYLIGLVIGCWRGQTSE
jgi:hypothetical protein